MCLQADLEGTLAFLYHFGVHATNLIPILHLLFVPLLSPPATRETTCWALRQNRCSKTQSSDSLTTAADLGNHFAGFVSPVSGV